MNSSKCTQVFVPITGKALWRALGFTNERAFQRARKEKKIKIPLYPVLGSTRGVYARSDDLAKYLGEVGRSKSMRSRPMKT